MGLRRVSQVASSCYKVVNRIIGLSEVLQIVIMTTYIPTREKWRKG